MKKLIFTLSIALLVGACSQPADTGTPFATRTAEWEAAMIAGDVDSIAALYSSDARIMPPNGETMIGQDAVREMFGGMIEQGLSAKLTSIDSQSGGDVAFNIGTFELMAGDDMIDHGKFIETWMRGDDGKWRTIDADAFVPTDPGDGEE